MAQTRKLLLHKGEVLQEIRVLREHLKAQSARAKARDLAQEIYDNFNFTGDLQALLIIDALTEMTREVIREERARHRAAAHAAGAAEDIATGTPQFPDFAQICDACPSNYALPGEDDPSETVYIETFDEDMDLLPAGVQYLRALGTGTLRNANALDALYRLCQRLGGRAGETPREILKRSGYDPGDD